LPVDFRTIRTLSAIALVQRSGYLENPAEFTRESVLGVLRANPSLIEDWMIWSQDQRTSPAWAFDTHEDGYRVVLAPGGKKMIFADKFEACAEFVIRQIRSIARFARPSH
jgi:hypothetical protein